jgi:hypothetical protein
VATDNNIEAVLAQLEIERRKREDEKIAAGTAVRLPLHVVIRAGVEDPAVIEKLKEQSKAEIKARDLPKDDPREVLWDDATLIYTGVPRADITPPDWQPSPMSEKDPAHPIHRRAAAIEAVRDITDNPPAPAPELVPAPEWKWTWVTIASPRDERDCGVVEEIRFRVEGSVLHIEFRDGRAFRSPIGANDDPLAAARRLARDKIGRHTSFDQPIRYPPRSSIH